MPEEASASIALLAVGVTMVLVVATLAGEILRARATGPGPHPSIEAYNARVNSWWAMMVLISLALISGRVGVILLFAFASFAALREFLTITTKRKADHWSLVVAFYVVFPVQYILVWLDQPWLFTSFVPVYAFLFLPILSALRGDAKSYLRRVSETQWALMICVYCASHVPALLNFDYYEDADGDRGALLIAFLVLVVQFGDLGEYYYGRNFGKRRIAPGISPKTREGVAAGTLVAAAMGGALTWITPFGFVSSVLVAVAIYLMGVGGSLVLAAIKRDRGVRNWGHLIPGQGGFIDQMDSVVFAAPAFFHLTALLLTL